MKSRSNKIFSNKKKTKRNGKKKSVGNVKRRRKSVRHMRRRRKSGGGKFKKKDHVHAKIGKMYFPGIIKKVNDKNKESNVANTYDIIFIDGETKNNIQEEDIMPLLVKNHINNPRVILHDNDNGIPERIANNHKNNANTTREEASIAYSEERKRLLENMMSESYNAYRNLKDYYKAESKMPPLKSRRAKRGRANLRENLKSKLDDSIDGIYRHLKLGQLVQNNKDIVGLGLQVNDTDYYRLDENNYKKVIKAHIRRSKALKRRASRRKAKKAVKRNSANRKSKKAANRKSANRKSKKAVKRKSANRKTKNTAAPADTRVNPFDAGIDNTSATGSALMKAARANDPNAVDPAASAASSASAASADPASVVVTPTRAYDPDAVVTSAASADTSPNSSEINNSSDSDLPNMGSVVQQPRPASAPSSVASDSARASPDIRAQSVPNDNKFPAIYSEVLNRYSIGNEPDAEKAVKKIEDYKRRRNPVLKNNWVYPTRPNKPNKAFPGRKNLLRKTDGNTQ